MRWTLEREVQVRTLPGWVHCVVFLGRIFSSNNASLHPGVKKANGKSNAEGGGGGGGGDPAKDWNPNQGRS